MPPPPQGLLLLRSNPFEHLRYLGQRKYRSGKMHWMTILWPWPQVMTVALINKNLLVCRIMWESLNMSIQSLVAIFLWSFLLLGYIWKKSVGNLCFAKFSLKILDLSFQGQTLYWTYVRIFGPIDVKWKGGASIGYWVNYVIQPLTSPLNLTFDFSRSSFK